MTFTPPPSAEEKYFTELRLDRCIKQYLLGMRTLRDFQHSSVGIALAKKMNHLQSTIND